MFSKIGEITRYCKNYLFICKYFFATFCSFFIIGEGNFLMCHFNIFRNLWQTGDNIQIILLNCVSSEIHHCLGVIPIVDQKMSLFGPAARQLPAKATQKLTFAGASTFPLYI